MSQQNQNNSQNPNRGGNNNQQHNQQPQRSAASQPLTTTLSKLTPISVGYNITDYQIEEFVLEAFRKAGFEPEAVRLQPYRNAGQSRVNVIAFFNKNDDRIMGRSTRNVLPHLVNRIDTEGIKLNNKFAEYAAAFAEGDNVVSYTRDKYLLVKLDIFAVIGLMLGAVPEQHFVEISGITNVGKDVVITAFKSTLVKRGKRKGKGDKFSSLI